MTELNGILCIDKPEGFTSFDVVAKLRGIARTRRVGHAGTLDPMATGVLPLFFGRATKACDLLPRQDKCYTAAFQLGVTTDTQDSSGRVLSERKPICDETQIRLICKQFTGEIQQTPPMYSAVRVGGKHLYELARQGIEVERTARPVTIYSLELLTYNPTDKTGSIEVHCSKGTYIRTLIADIGETLGCGAMMTGLRRTMAAGFTLSDCLTITAAAEHAAAGTFPETLLPIERAFAPLPRTVLNEKQTKMFLNGVRLDCSRVDCPPNAVECAVYSSQNIFLGTARITEGELIMTKLFTLEV